VIPVVGFGHTISTLWLAKVSFSEWSPESELWLCRIGFIGLVPLELWPLLGSGYLTRYSNWIAILVSLHDCLLASLAS
jgi:hypothetical protein